MFNYHFSKLGAANIFDWFLLCFNAGCINAGGFLTAGRFVSHVTGFATLFGVDLVSDQPESSLEILSVPVFFLFGSFLAGILIDRSIFKGKKPHFDYVMGLSALCLFLVSFGKLNHIERMGEFINLEEVYFRLALLCLACGLQNGAVTSSSGSSIRTTHLTGLTTDLGLGFSKLFIFDSTDERYLKERRANYLRMGSMWAFIVGSVVGSWMIVKFGYQAFYLPTLIALYAAWHGRRFKRVPHKTLI